MRSFPTIYRLLNLFGILQCVYERDKMKFVLRKFLIFYAIFFSLSLQVFLLIEGYVHIDVIALSSFGETHFNWFVTSGLLLFFSLYVILNLSASLTILYNIKKHCKLLNKLIKIDKQSTNLVVTNTKSAAGIQHTYELHIKLWYFAIVAIYFVAFPTYIYAYFGITVIGITRFIAIYCHSVQYLFGHLYEMIVIEKLCSHFKRLQLRDDVCVRQYFLLWHRYWALAVKATKFFAFSKIPTLVCVNLILSLYWFCNYDRLQNFLFFFVRQIVLYFVFVVCHNWHRLANEVS